MARARNIKPAFFKNDLLVEISFEFRLLFIGLWTLSDRCGRLEDRPKRIKMEIFPADDVDVNKGLDDLDKAGFIKRYQVDSNKYIQIISFEKHQSPHHKEPESAIPVCDEIQSSLGAAPGKPQSSLGVAALIPESLNLNPDCGLLTVECGLLIAEPIEKRVSSKRVIPSEITPIPAKEIIDLFNRKFPELPEVQKITPSRRKAVCGRWNDFKDLQSVEKFGEFFDHIRDSDFLMGRTPKVWGGLGFDWIFKSANFIKIYEGNYHGDGQ